MTGKIMGIIMIIFGAAMLIIGIVLVASKSQNHQSKESSSQLSHYNLGKSNPQDNKSIENQKIPSSTVEAEVSHSSNEDKSNLSPKAIGNTFEDFVVNLLADWRLTLLDRTQDAVSSAGVVAESSKNPDLHVSQKRGNRNIDYFIECKYRSKWDNEKVQFEKWQIERYHQFQRQEKRKVIIALGVGGSPSSPETFMLVPIDSLKRDAIRKIDTQYIVQPNSSALIEYMNSYFTTVFKKAKSKDK